MFYVILGWVLQSQQSFLVCKWHCVCGAGGASGTTETQSLIKEEAQVKVNFQRKGEQWGNGNGQRFVTGHVSEQLEKLSLVAVSGGKQGLSNVWVMSRKLCRALGRSVLFTPLLLCGKMAQSAPALSPWAEQLSHYSTAFLTGLGTWCVTGGCPCWKPSGKGVSVAGVPALPSEAQVLQFPKVLESVCGDIVSLGVGLKELKGN